MRQLPSWLKAESLLRDRKTKTGSAPSRSAFDRGHPKIQRAIFPSKIWNSIAAGRRLICTGFAGEMATELEDTKRAPFGSHLEQWTRLLVDLATCPQSLTSTEVSGLAPVRPELQPTLV